MANPEIPTGYNENIKKNPALEEHKSSIFSKISDALRELSNSVKGWFGDNNEKKTNIFQDFMINMLATFNGIDIEKGLTINNQEELKKIQEIIKPVVDLNDTSIELKEGDFVRFNKEWGTVDIYPADSTQENGHSISSTGNVTITERQDPIPQPEPVDEGNEDLNNSIGNQLANYLAKRGPAKTGENTCGEAVKILLHDFGIKPTPQGNGNQWYGKLSADSRFKEVKISSLDEIPAGGIMTYSGKGTRGSDANHKWGHVEIMGHDGNGNNKVYSYYASTTPGGSAKAPELENNFDAWKKATGFQGVFVPVSKTA